MANIYKLVDQPVFQIKMSQLLSAATKNGDFLDMLEWVHYGIHQGYLKLIEVPAPPPPLPTTAPTAPPQAPQAPQFESETESLSSLSSRSTSPPPRAMPPPIFIAPKDALALVEENAKRHHEKAISLSNDLSIKEVIVAPQPEEQVSVASYSVAARVLNPITYHHTNWLSNKSVHLNHFFTRALAVVEQTDYSRKVFLGGIPYRMNNAELVAAFAAYNARTAQLPSIDVRGHKQPGSRDFGYAYLVLASTEDLKRLLTDILKESLKEAQRSLSRGMTELEFNAKFVEQTTPGFMRQITSSHNVKNAQVIPWKVSDSTYPTQAVAIAPPMAPSSLMSSTNSLEATFSSPTSVSNSHSFIKPSCSSPPSPSIGEPIVEERTIFMGSLHGTATASQLAKLLEDNFGPVESVVIDTDEFRYPSGSGRATFVRRLDYEKAVKTQFLNMSSLTGTVKRKTLQIDPFVIATQCALCKDRISSTYCKNCGHKLCDMCIHLNHSSQEAYDRHTFIRLRPSKSRRRSSPSLSDIAVRSPPTIVEIPNARTGPSSINIETPATRSAPIEIPPPTAASNLVNTIFFDFNNNKEFLR